MLTLIRRHRLWFFALTLAAVLLRLYFVFHMRVIEGDSLVYGELARGLVTAHKLALEKSWGWQATMIRLPGYPLFLALSFLVGGVNNYTPALLVQVVVDVLTCFLLADIARRVFSATAARIAFVLAALSPFLMSYVGTPLTECLEIFFTAAAIDCAICGMESYGRRWWCLAGAATGAAILLRPDGGLLMGSLGLVLLYQLWRKRSQRRRIFTAGVLLVACSLAPLLPWTARNWHTFHIFQPLVNADASDPGEYEPNGWNLWIGTWLADYHSVEDLSFHVSGEPMSFDDVPSYAFATPEQREKVRVLFEQYNQRKFQMTADLDSQFRAIAEESRRLHPLRTRLLTPALRTADMWFRPRIEMLPIDPHWWEARRAPVDFLLASSLGLLNLLLVLAAVAGGWLLRRRLHGLGFLVCYPVIRTLFLSTIGSTEDRYTMECMPAILVLAACLLAWWWMEVRRQPRRA